MKNGLFAVVVLFAAPGFISCGMQNSVDVSSTQQEKSALEKSSENVTLLPQREASLTTSRKAVLVTLLQNGKPISSGEEFEFSVREGFDPPRSILSLSDCSEDCRFGEEILRGNTFVLKSGGRESVLTGYVIRSENANMMRVFFDFR